MDRNAHTAVDDTTREEPVVRVPGPGQVIGLLLVTPEPDRSGYDLHRSIRHLPHVIAVDIVAADGTAQVRIRVPDRNSLDTIAARFRLQAGVAQVTAIILGPDTTDPTCPDYPAL